MELLELELRVPDLPAVAAFYAEVLALPMQFDDGREVVVQLGWSRLVFRAAAAGTRPFYHLAITIPANQIEEARQWLEKRVVLLPLETGEVVANFINWEAKSVYFHDPAGNILELIARRPLRNESVVAFGPQALLGLNEVGLVVPNVTAFREEITAAAGLPAYARGPVRPDFAALGTDAGLLIVTQVGRGWLPTGRPAGAYPLRLRYRYAGQEHLLARPTLADFAGF